MPQPKHLNQAALLLVLPLLALGLFVYRQQLEQQALSQTYTVKAKPLFAPFDSSDMQGSPYASFHWKPTAAQNVILKQRWKSLKTLPPSIAAAGSALPAANTTYTLSNQYDLNGFQYYLADNKTQYCQWSTLNDCWCIRSSLVKDSPAVRPGAEYCSYGKQTYTTGPAGAYWYGGMCPRINKSMPPVVTAAESSRRRPQQIIPLTRLTALSASAAPKAP